MVTRKTYIRFLQDSTIIYSFNSQNSESFLNALKFYRFAHSRFHISQDNKSRERTIARTRIKSAPQFLDSPSASNHQESPIKTKKERLEQPTQDPKCQKEDPRFSRKVKSFLVRPFRFPLSQPHLQDRTRNDPIRASKGSLSPFISLRHHPFDLASWCT